MNIGNIFLITSYYSDCWNKDITSFLKEKNISTYNYNDSNFIIEFIKDMENFQDALKNNYIKSKIIKPENQILKLMPHPTRRIFSPVTFNIHEVKEDDLFPNKYKSTISFALGKGSYATIAIPQFLGKIENEVQ